MVKKQELVILARKIKIDITMARARLELIRRGRMRTDPIPALIY